ncbi:ABC-type polysaccharide/polyol phosphate transport system, ATPase component [Pseudomonas sp. GM50]|jgi:lipopolysaccharide transport system ATP-binding protein|uniref:ABC transporter ATP-binding protein n=1 Tax=Pseudomonas sp. GM50 TaxID=1144332 RepID=UPI00027090AA|nr:ABC transporter ATP-binding protein [Pseudomonas sp. GM50]EJM65080.1 ABC-type polysaccharide/polyol phosphate transport system, ATPase component [Pseudomonas sp. GM50]
MSALIEVNGLWKKYSKDLGASVRYAAKDLMRGAFLGKGGDSELRESEFWALRDINFSLRRGEVLAILGHNGAGKSTLLKCIAGKLKADRGSVVHHGDLGHLLEMSAGFAQTMTGRDNVSVRGRLMGKGGKDLTRYIEEVKEFADIDDFFDSPVQFYSSGMKSRLGFAASSVMTPDILIIDEVLAVGDLAFRLRCYERINELARNAAVIFVSHSVGQVARLCNRGIYLEKGCALFDGGVQQAISLYQDKVGDQNEKKRGHVYHADLVSFDLKVNGELFTPGKKLGYGAALALDIDISRLADNVQIRVLLKDASQSVLMDWNSARCELEWPETASILHADLGRAELTPGAYSLSIQVMSPDGVDHVSLSESIPLRVTGDYYYAVPVQRTAQWSFKEVGNES